MYPKGVETAIIVQDLKRSFTKVQVFYESLLLTVPDRFRSSHSSRRFFSAAALARISANIVRSREISFSASSLRQAVNMTAVRATPNVTRGKCSRLTPFVIAYERGDTDVRIEENTFVISEDRRESPR